jgi:hypothetical protein
MTEPRKPIECAHCRTGVVGRRHYVRIKHRLEPVHEHCRQEVLREQREIDARENATFAVDRRDAILRGDIA